MPVAISGGARIRTNTPAENAYNSLMMSSNAIAKHQLAISTGKRINAASDDVAGYITARSLQSRNGSLKSALKSVGDAKNVTAIAQDAYENIGSLLTEIKNNTATAASAALGEDEKVALAKASARLVEQIETVVNSTVFGGQNLIKGEYEGKFTVGFNKDNAALTIGVNLKSDNADFNIPEQDGDTPKFQTHIATGTGGDTPNFAGVKGFDLKKFAEVKKGTLGIYATGADNIEKTLQNLTMAIENMSKAASYVGGVENRLTSQEELLKSQITNYNAAISRIEDADMAEQQLGLVKAQFLQSTSLTSLAQANQNPNAFMQLMR